MGETGRDALKLVFDWRLRLEFHGSTITSDAGLLACRELDGILGLTEAAPAYLWETRTGRNVQHQVVPLLRQAVYSRLAGYEDTNDAVRLAKDPAMCAVIGRRALEKSRQVGAGTSVLNRFETEVLVTGLNLNGLEYLNAEWVQRAMIRTKHRRIILDMDSSESPVHGEQEGAAYNGHFGCVCYHPLFVFNQFGDCEGAMLRPGNVHSAESWRMLLDPISARYDRSGIRKYFRGDAAFANPDIYKYLERHDFFYAIRLPSNEVLQREIQHLMKRPMGRPPKKPIIWYHSFQYQAGSWDRPRRVVAKVEWHQGELLPRVGFIVTNMVAKAKGVVHFYNGRGTAEQWIKEGKYALNWTRLSCHKFVANQVRLHLFILAYNLGNFMRRLGLPDAVKDWSLRSLQLKLIKMGGRMVRHARYIVFQLAEAAVPKELFAAILERLNRLRLAPA
ncbi:MAG: IS1380 family transposase [Dehalococcoidia bacterium]|nr:IS1380 family transposase [Dehalococcoidia bacterium]